MPQDEQNKEEEMASAEMLDSLEFMKEQSGMLSSFAAKLKSRTAQAKNKSKDNQKLNHLNSLLENS